MYKQTYTYNTKDILLWQLMTLQIWALMDVVHEHPITPIYEGHTMFSIQVLGDDESLRL
jgi:hypothetical protein